MVNDPSQSPTTPQFQMGATAEDAKTAASQTNLPGPGAIANRLSQQFQMPRASVDSEINRDGHGLPNG